jgi:dihydrofolate synthase/folylpolyglutamate synthase
MDDLLTEYSEAIETLFARTTSGTKFGLERTEAILARLGNPHRHLEAIHVAGTNGKGSVVATAEALLRATGLKVGRYTSPHLIDFRERITVNSIPISEEAVLEFLERWIPEAEEIGATFFELTTALAFEWFAWQEVDIAVIETGLGGRLDSTNVLMPRVATVTSIGLDHTDLLGDTLEAIAREKAGIFKRGAPAVIGEASPPIRELLSRCAKDAGARPIVMIDDEYRIDDIQIAERGTAFTLRHSEIKQGIDASLTRSKSGHPLDTRLERGASAQRIDTPLIGAYQARNTAVALATVSALGEEYLPLPNEISKALATLFLPGRFQRHGKFIFDVAHNPAGARTVAETLTALDPRGPRTALVAILADKDWRGIIRELAGAVDEFLFTNAPSAPAERRWDPEAAHAFATAEGYDSHVEQDIGVALASAEKRSGTVLVTGSFHTVGDAMSRLQVSPFAA